MSAVIRIDALVGHGIANHVTNAVTIVATTLAEKLGANANGTISLVLDTLVSLVGALGSLGCKKNLADPWSDSDRSHLITSLKRDC